MKKWMLFTIAVFSLSCTSAPPVDPAADAKGIPDAEIGLRPGSVFEEPDQKPILFNETDPGESEIPKRAYPSAPPVVPHTIAGIEPITAGENQCIDCHARDAAADFGATAIPASHYRDLRNAPDKDRDEIAGARYNCTTCHVPQTRAQPLVEMMGT